MSGFGVRALGLHGLGVSSRRLFWGILRGLAFNEHGFHILGFGFPFSRDEPIMLTGNLSENDPLKIY